MIYSTSDIELHDSSFTNIKSVNTFIVGFDSIEIDRTYISNIVLNDSFIALQFQSLSSGTDSKSVSLTNSVFENIRSQTSIIQSWNTIQGNVIIDNVDFRHISEGSIYDSVFKASSDVYISNTNISTSQSATNDQNSLLYFHYSDTVSIENLQVVYYYDLNVNCERDSEGVSDNLIQASYALFNCTNPISLISNPGSVMTMNNVDINVEITDSDTQSFRERFDHENYDYIAMEYTYVEGQRYYHSIISNFGILKITNLNVYGLPPADRFIANYNSLDINQLNIIIDKHYSQYDPNALQSGKLISQVNGVANTKIYNSNLSGAQHLIFVQNGYLTIQDSTLHHAGTAITSNFAKNITISGCKFFSIGRYWSQITRAVNEEREFAMLNLDNVEETVLFEYNHLSGFENCCCSLFFLRDSDEAWVGDVIVRNNVFTVDDDNLFYNVDNSLTDVCNNYRGLLSVVFANQVSIYENNFFKNDIFPEEYWLFLEFNWETCLSANNFTNHAFLLSANPTTSCFRKELFECINSTCNEGDYGNVDTTLNAKVSHFNIDINNNINSFFKTTNYYGYLAMDNIQINVLQNGSIVTEKNKYWNFYIENVFLLIMDSIFSPNVKVFHDSICSVTDNDRIAYNTTHIAKLQLLCPYNWAVNPNYTNLNNTLINYVDHFSVTQMDFTSSNATYYPGDRLQFHYVFSDRLNNEISRYAFNYSAWVGANETDNTTSFIVNLNSRLFLLNQDVDIQQHGLCNLCDSGVIIFGLGLNDPLVTNNNNTLLIEASLEKSIMALKENSINLLITSCPIGWGADTNNYQCNECPQGTYNLLPNNAQPCKSCNQEENYGVICFGGDVFVRRNYWLGFENNGENMVVSRCPSLYCCNEDEVCIYSNGATLCAKNRNLSVPLCGSCIDGYTEAINSVECLICDEYDNTWLIKPIVLAICYALYLSMCHPIKIKSKEIKMSAQEDIKFSPLESNAAKPSYGWNILLKCKHSFAEPYYVLLCKSIILRVLLYYEQALGYVLWPTEANPYMHYFMHIASIFNLEPSITESNPKPVCLVDDLTSKSKILLGLLPWGMIFALLCIIFGLHLVTKYFVGLPTKCPNYCNINYLKAVLAFLIICVGQILAVCFKLLTCTWTGSIRVHFYFGNEICDYFHTQTTIVAISVIFIIALIFFIMWIQLYRETQNERENPNYYLNQLCKYYKPEYYFWEFLVLSRRVIIALFPVFYTWNWFSIVLITILLVFLGLQYKFQPYRAIEANFAECLSLYSLIIVIAIECMMSQNISEIQAASIIIALFIVCPIIIAIVYLILYTQYHKKQNDITNENPSESTTSNTTHESMPLKADGGFDHTMEYNNEDKIIIESNNKSKENSFSTDSTPRKGLRGMHQSSQFLESSSGTDLDSDHALEKITGDNTIKKPSVATHLARESHSINLTEIKKQ